MDFFRNVFNHFRGNNAKREDENKCCPGMEGNDNQSINEVIPRPEMDIEVLPDVIDRTFEINRTNGSDMIGYHQRNLPRLFGGFSSFNEIFDQFEEAMNEMERHFFGSFGFENFSGANFGDLRDGPGMFMESEKTLTGERLRNYYLNGGNTGDPYQGGSQISAPNDTETLDNTGNLFINNENRSGVITTTPNSKNPLLIMTIQIGHDGMSEIANIWKFESGNGERK